MTKGNWLALLILTGIVDFIQLVIIEGILVWLFGAGIALNEIIDPIVGVAIAGYLYKKNVPLITRPYRLIALAGSEIAAIISAGVAQFWILSVWYIRHDVLKEEAGFQEAQQKQTQLTGNVRQPYNQNGVRLPRAVEYSRNDTPLNMDGIRAPNGGL